MKWVLCCVFFVGVFSEKGIQNAINVGPDNVPFDACSVAAAYNEDTRVEIFVLGLDDAIWHRAQPKYVSPALEWAPWSSLGGSFKDGPTVIRNGDGKLMVFSRGSDNHVYFKTQLEANANADQWGSWESLEGDLASRPSVILDSEGLVKVFGRAKNNTLVYRAQFFNGTHLVWQDWEDLGGSLSAAPTVIVDSEGLLHIFGRATDRSLFHLTQNASAEFLIWNKWKTMGGTLASNPRVPLLNNDVNLLEIVVRGSDKAFWVKAQVSNHHDTVAWSKWGSLGGVFASGPATLINNDGLADVFGRGVDKKIYGKHQYLTESGTAWSEWTDYGGVTTTAPEVARRPDGTAVLFVRNPDKEINIKFQVLNTTDFSLSWSEWMSIGGLTKSYAC
jgi:hypothetical protein